MDKHVHEWHFITDSSESRALMISLVQWWGCRHCDEVMPPEEAERRLNATERLSARDAERLAERNVHSNAEVRKRLQAYASALEGE